MFCYLILMLIIIFLILRIILYIFFIFLMKLHWIFIILLRIVIFILIIKRTSLKIDSGAFLNIIKLLSFLLLVIKVISIWRADVVINRWYRFLFPLLIIIHSILIIFYIPVFLSSLQSSSSYSRSCLHSSPSFIFKCCCILLRLSIFFCLLINFNIFITILTVNFLIAFFKIILILIFLELGVEFKFILLVKIWILSIIVRNNCSRGVI